MVPLPLTLSSPCGYFGDFGLQHCSNPFAGLLLRDHSSLPLRSHYDDIRLFHDGNAWQLEAHVLVHNRSEERGCWVHQATYDARDTEFRRKCASANRSSARLGSFALPPEITSAFNCYHDAQKSLFDQCWPHLAAYFARVAPSVVPLERSMSYPAKLAVPALDEWISQKREALLKLQRKQVPDLLDQIAEEMERQFPKALIIAGEQTLPQFVNSAHEFFEFLASLFKLHWYLGDDDWSDDIQKINDRFPQSEPPSPAWVLDLRADSPWRKMRPEKNAVGYPLDRAAAHARVWMCPGVYRETQAIVDLPTCSMMWNEFVFEQDATDILGALCDPWTPWQARRYYWPEVISREIAARNCVETGYYDEGNELCSTVEFGFDDRYWGRVSRFLEIVAERDDWLNAHQSAFPSPRRTSAITLEQLRDYERVGFAIREFEVELEGENAWERALHNALFDDAYGARRIALRVSELSNRRRFAGLRRSAHLHEFKELSDDVQLLLQSFVKRFLQQKSGVNWLNAVPPKVKERVEKTADGKPLASMDEFFRCTDLTHYDDILKADCNWPDFSRRFLMHAGIGKPSKRQFDHINRWKNWRNAGAHPERADELNDAGYSRTLEELRGWLLNWHICFDLLWNDSIDVPPSTE